MSKPTRILKTATIQEILSKKTLKNGEILTKNYTSFWTILPKKIIKTRQWEKGDKLIFIPLEDLVEAKPGDVIIRRNNNGGGHC